MNIETVGVGREIVGGGEEEYEIDPIFDYDCIMIVANALRTPIRPYYGAKGGQGLGKRRKEEEEEEEEDEDPSNEPSPEVVELAKDILNRAAAAQGSTSQKVRVSKSKKYVRGPRIVGQRRPPPTEKDVEDILIYLARKRSLEERPPIVRPEPLAARDYALGAAEGVVGPDVRRVLVNAINTILTAPGALTRFYERYQKYIKYGVNFIGLTDIARPNSIIVATITALIQTIAEFIPTPTDALGGLLNTGVNVATILYQGLPLLIPGLIAYGCATAGEALVHGTIRGVRRAVTDPLGVARGVTRRAADIRDVVARLLAQGPRLFLGNLAVGAFNALMDTVDPDGRFHRLESFTPGAVGPSIQAHLEEITGRRPTADAAAAAPGMRPVLQAVLLVPPEIPGGNIEDIRVRIRDLLEGPVANPAEAVPGGPVGTTDEERNALLALLQLAEHNVVMDDDLPQQEGGKRKPKYKTAKNKRKTPRTKKMSKKNLRRRH